VIENCVGGVYGRGLWVTWINETLYLRNGIEKAVYRGKTKQKVYYLCVKVSIATE